MYWWGTKLHFFSSDPGSFLISSQSQTQMLNLHLPPWSWLHMKKICHIQGEESGPRMGKWYLVVLLYFSEWHQDIIRHECSVQHDPFSEVPLKLLHGSTGLCSKSSTHTCTHTHTQMRSDKGLLSQSRAPRPHTFFLSPHKVQGNM